MEWREDEPDTSPSSWNSEALGCWLGAGLFVGICVIVTTLLGFSERVMGLDGVVMSFAVVAPISAVASALVGVMLHGALVSQRFDRAAHGFKLGVIVAVVVPFVSCGACLLVIGQALS